MGIGVLVLAYFRDQIIEHLDDELFVVKNTEKLEQYLCALLSHRKRELLRKL